MLHESTLLAETLVTDLAGSYQTDAITDSGQGVGVIVAVVLVIMMVAAGIHLFFRKPKIDNTPIGLLNELCMANGISTAGTRLVNAIALRSGLEHPGVMLLSEANFDAALESAQLKMKLDHGKAKTLGIVRRQLFDA